MGNADRTPHKKPPAPSTERRRSDPPSIKAEIATELYIAMEGLGAGADLISIIGSYGDTLPDEEVLELLRRKRSNHPTSAECSGARGGVPGYISS